MFGEYIKIVLVFKKFKNDTNLFLKWLIIMIGMGTNKYLYTFNNQ